QPEAVTKSLEVIADKGGILPERLAYLKIYGEINQPQCVPLLSKIAGDNTYKVAIRLACMQALKHYNAPEIGKTLTEAYAYKIRANPRVRAAALSLFSSRADWAISFLKLIYDKRAIKKTEVPLEVVRQFKLMGNEQINTMVDALWPSVQIASSADKAATALRIKEALAAGMGTMSAGKPIYQKVCGNCHRLGEEGRNIGPDLTGYDRRDLNYLVLNIVDPNADIREGYVNYLVEKKDGQALFGTLVDRSDAALTLRALNGFETTLAQSEIAVLEAQSTSLMPERIIEPLSDQEIRDLFAYLQQQEVN
ncbi:MAG: dehydrogenase, partial [Bacteroidota bacterium]